MSLNHTFARTQAEQDDISIHNLVVVDFQTLSKKRNPSIQNQIDTWRENNTPLYTMSCAQQIWYGSESDFSDFPDLSGDPASLQLKGAQAYAHLASFATGFYGKFCDTHNRKQFMDAWKDVCRTMPERAERAEKLMKNLNYDAKTVISKITGQLRTTDRMSVAADLSQQQKGDQSLIITNLTKNGSLSDNCIRMIAAIEKINRGTSYHNKYVRLTTPNPDDLPALRDAVFHTKKHASSCTHNIRSTILFPELDDALMHIADLDRVYIDTAMDEHPAVDRIIQYMWSEDHKDSATITHLKGKPSERGLSTKSWSAIDLANYYSVEETLKEVQTRKRAISAAFTTSQNAFQTIAQLRLEGITPNQTNLRKQDPDVFSLVL